MILFTTRGRFCLSVLMHLVHTLPSRSGPVFSNYPDMHRVPRVHTKSRVPLSSGHLAWIISVRSPDPRGTLTLKHQLTCPIKSDHMHAAACHFLTSPLVPLHICLLHKFSLLLSPLPPFLALPPWGVLLALYMPRQLHHSRLHAQVHGHRLEGNWQYDYFYRQSLTGCYFPTTLVCYLIPLLG